MVKKKEEPSRSAVDWEEAALEVFATGGVHAVSIPSLARTLGVTKGSFYWHFKNFDDLVDAALRRWEDRDRAALAAVEAISDPRKRLETLFRDAMEHRQAHALYVSLSGSSVARVAAAIKRVSQRRLAFLVDAYKQLGFDAGESRRRALLVYSAYVGLLHLRNEGSPSLRTAKDIDDYVAHAVTTLIPKRAKR
jgi:AcrR family transcriptional regulator